MTFTSSLQMVAFMACLLFTFSAETAAESGTMTVAGCRLQPLSPPPSISTHRDRCQWYLDQITACGRISADTATPALETYTRKANELECRGNPGTPARVQPEANTPGISTPVDVATPTRSTPVSGGSDRESGTVTIAGCRYKPLAPPPDVPDSGRCRWYAVQIETCKGRRPIDMGGASVDPAVAYRKRASELGCSGAGPGLASCLLLRMAFSVLAYLLTWF